MVLVPGELHVPRSLPRRMRRGDISITADLAFADVMTACAEPRDDQGGTWITEEMIAAYTALHVAGHAHSMEAWQDGLLVGGLYGVSLGRAFFGESMFTRVPDASKIALRDAGRPAPALGVWPDRLPDEDRASGALSAHARSRVRRLSDSSTSLWRKRRRRILGSVEPYGG